MNSANRSPYVKHLALYAVLVLATLLVALPLISPGKSASAAAAPASDALVPPPVPTAPPTVGTATPVPTATSGVPSPVPTGVATPCPINFSDVHTTDWFYEAVRWVVCGGVAGGYTDNTFRPNNNTTRGQLAKMAVIASRWPLRNPAQPTFSDVPANHPFYAFVETAAYHSVISGYSDGTFRPGNNVTRGQLSKIVVLAMGWPLHTPATPTFSDVPAGSPFFAFVETAVYKTVVSGYTDGSFRPGSDATRAQLAKIVQRAYTLAR